MNEYEATVKINPSDDIKFMMRLSSVSMKPSTGPICLSA